MNDWARSRKRIILAIVLLAVAILVGVPFFLLFYQVPTCSDGVMNGDESGVDCGGSCARLCNAESLPIISKGDPRVLTIAPNTFEVVSLVENPNQSAEIRQAKYTFKIYDAAGVIPVKVVEGSTFVPRGASFAIFEGPFTLEAGVTPARATLEWEVDALSWEKSDAAEPSVELAGIALSEASTTPRLSAVVENLSLGQVSNLDFVALISDSEGNLFAASKTFVDNIAPGESAPIVFIWPRPFVKEATQIEIVKRIFPDRSFIK